MPYRHYFRFRLSLLLPTFNYHFTAYSPCRSVFIFLRFSYAFHYHFHYFLPFFIFSTTITPSLPRFRLLMLFDYFAFQRRRCARSAAAYVPVISPLYAIRFRRENIRRLFMPRSPLPP